MCDWLSNLWEWHGLASDLFTTAIGVAAGVWGGLWLNRKTEAAAGQARRVEVAHVLDILRTAIEENQPRLARFGQELARGWTLYGTGLDISTWDALRSALTGEFRDADFVATTRATLLAHGSRREAQ
jgi:hypothetical protein